MKMTWPTISLPKDPELEEKYFHELEEDIIQIEKEAGLLEKNAPFRKYEKEYFKEIGNSATPVKASRVIEAASSADIVYLGDYHFSPECQDVQLAVLDAMAAKSAKDGRPLHLAVEFFAEPYQDAVDEYLAGKLTPGQLAHRTNFDEEMGVNFESYVRLLDYARDHGIAVHATEYSRDDRKGKDLYARDEHAANSIVNLFDNDEVERPRVAVVYGTYHTSPGHLPKQVDRRLDEPTRNVSIISSAPDIYWSLAYSMPGEDLEAARVKEDVFYVPEVSETEHSERYLNNLDACQL
jgi:hypothetical protein